MTRTFAWWVREPGFAQVWILQMVRLLPLQDSSAKYCFIVKLHYHQKNTWRHLPRQTSAHGSQSPWCNKEWTCTKIKKHLETSSKKRIALFPLFAYYCPTSSCLFWQSYVSAFDVPWQIKINYKRRSFTSCWIRLKTNLLFPWGITRIFRILAPDLPWTQSNPNYKILCVWSVTFRFLQLHKQKLGPRS